MENKLIRAGDLLRALRDDPDLNGTNFALVKRHIENAQTVDVQKWIPVSERLPDEEHESVVLAYSGDVDTAIVSGDTFLEYDKYEGWEICNVTHWMPLPEAPKGE